MTPIRGRGEIRHIPRIKELVASYDATEEKSTMKDPDFKTQEELLGPGPESYAFFIQMAQESNLSHSAVTPQEPMAEQAVDELPLQESPDKGDSATPIKIKSKKEAGGGDGSIGKLKKLAHEVYETIKRKQTMTIQEIGDTIFAASQGKKDDRRRHYDIINVMTALRMVKKDGKTIHWVGEYTPEEQTTKIAECKQRVAELRQRCDELSQSISLIKRLVEYNKRRFPRGKLEEVQKEEAYLSALSRWNNGTQNYYSASGCPEADCLAPSLGQQQQQQQQQPSLASLSPSSLPASPLLSSAHSVPKPHLVVPSEESCLSEAPAPRSSELMLERQYLNEDVERMIRSPAYLYDYLTLAFPFVRVPFLLLAVNPNNGVDVSISFIYLY